MRALAIDGYTFQARTIPVLVVALPPIVLVATGLISGARLGVALGTVMAVFSSVAGQLGRDRGKRLEPGLWREWGGSPSLQALRYEGADRPERVTSLHEHVARVTGHTLPSRSEERSDPKRADDRYQDAIGDLIALTRDRQRFDLLFAENVNYGMRRNLLGLRPFGIAAAVATLIAAALLLVFAAGSFSTRLADYGAGAGVALATLAFWVLVVRPAWVRTPADGYARRLAEAATALARSP